MAPGVPPSPARGERLDAIHAARRPGVLPRVAAVLFVAAGFLTVVTSTLLTPETAEATVTVGATAVVIGAVTWLLPWHRWPPSSSMVLAPIALVVVAAGNRYAASEPFDYAVYFVIVHVWLGLAHPPRASLLLAPLTTVAYVAPLFAVADDVPTALVSALVVVPLSVLTGETVAWVVRRLDQTEHDRAGLEAMLDDERSLLERFRAAQADLEFLAFHDAVTGLPNRAFFEEHLRVTLASARRRGDRVAVCVLDLDRFKLVNDTAGHAAGDAFLRAVGGRIRGALREGDLVARVGGDEFLVVAPIPRLAGDGPAATDADAADQLRSRLVEALERPVEVGGMEFRVGASVGVAVMPDDGLDGRALLRRADGAMYREKRRRSGAVAVAREAGEADDVAGLTRRLERAAATGDWELAFQPVVELVLERTIGAEALLRWPVRGPDARVLGPSSFIPVAEELGLMREIGDWVMEELARRCELWRRAGVFDDLRFLSFNVSPRELWHPGFADRVAAMADAVGRADLLVAEITESALAMDPARAVTVLEQARACGVRVAIDDFGSGHSSLARLRELPIDLVKIDRGFLDGIEEDGPARSIVRSVLRLCQGLGVVALAEGVERRAQADFLVREGCVLAQGYLFGAPSAPEDLTAELRRAEALADAVRGGSSLGEPRGTGSRSRG
ncbi:MAG TPA: EAL domain-containing protein [Actinomycetota bacterium]|nr:EAL domain-containing protein [Actinomycetota bacterium]